MVLTRNLVRFKIPTAEQLLRCLLFVQVNFYMAEGETVQAPAKLSVEVRSVCDHILDLVQPQPALSTLNLHTLAALCKILDGRALHEGCKSCSLNRLQAYQRVP